MCVVSGLFSHRRTSIGLSAPCGCGAVNSTRGLHQRDVHPWLTLRAAAKAVLTRRWKPRGKPEWNLDWAGGQRKADV